VRDMTERPQSLVGKAVVMAGLFFGAQPDAAQLVGRVFWRHRDAVVVVHGVAVGAAAAGCYPYSGTGAHDRLERRHQAAGRTLDLDRLAAQLVDVGLAVGDDDHVGAAQLAVQHGAQRCRVPGQLALVARAALGLEFAAQALHVAEDGLELGGWRRRRPGRGGGGRPAQQAFAAQQGARPGDPAAPRELRDDDGDQRDGGGQTKEEIEQVAPRLLAAPINETHVLNEHQAPVRVALARRRLDGDVQWALGGVQDMLVLAVVPVVERGAADLRRHRRRRQQLALRLGAVADGVQMLVLADAREKGRGAGRRSARQLLFERFLDRLGDHRRAHVEVAHRPAQGEIVDQRGDGVGKGRQGQQQGHQEAQRKAHGTVLGHARCAQHPRVACGSGTNAGRARIGVCIAFSPAPRSGVQRAGVARFSGSARGRR